MLKMAFCSMTFIYVAAFEKVSETTNSSSECNQINVCANNDGPCMFQNTHVLVMSYQLIELVEADGLFIFLPSLCKL